jgi:uncharacterized damage-inducible protein DinB
MERVLIKTEKINGLNNLGRRMKLISKPQEGEYAPYAIMYIKLVPDGLILQHLRSTIDTSCAFYQAIPKEKLDKPHQAGEWTIKEILLHVIDDERIYAYRALRAARGDETELPGFDQDAYVPCSEANSRSLDSLLDEFIGVRMATIRLFENLPDAAWRRSVVANGHLVTVRALAYHLAGHELHHIESIRENYLGNSG